VLFGEKLKIGLPDPEPNNKSWKNYKIEANERIVGFYGQLWNGKPKKTITALGFTILQT